jgi:hypothetical protein
MPVKVAVPLQAIGNRAYGRPHSGLLSGAAEQQNPRSDVHRGFLL